MPQPAIRNLTLFKQGIGYFIRRGEVDERTVSLVIPREATNDVLKSLNVIVHSGGQVLGVDYETPEDKAQVLSELSIRLADRSSIRRGFLPLSIAMERGRRVRLSEKRKTLTLSLKRVVSPAPFPQGWG